VGEDEVDPRRKQNMPGPRRINEMDRIFLELLRNERVPRYGKASFRPNADVYFDGSRNAFIVKLELSGIDPTAVSLQVEENMLTIAGIRQDEHHPEAVYQQMEISYGGFERRVLLPPEVDATRASADYANGFLEIVLPLRERPEAKRIPITVREGDETVESGGPAGAGTTGGGSK
jgi:HSP20 family protein